MDTRGADGQRQAYPLDAVQCNALVAMAKIPESELLAVNTPHGTGKISLLLERASACPPDIASRFGVAVQVYASHGLMTGTPPASKGAVSRVATIIPWAAAVAAI